MKKVFCLLLLSLLFTAVFAMTGCKPDSTEDGNKNECDHVFSSVYTTDAESHWYACTLGCGTKYKLEAHSWPSVDESNTTKQPTCMVQGQAVLKCTTCNKEKIKILPKTTHAVGTAFSANDTHHWQICQDCNSELNKKAHSYATCSYNINQHWFECQCGATGDKVNHTWVDVNENDTNPTKEQKCSDEKCHATRTINTNHEHIYDEGVITREPTCTVAGIKTFTCTVTGCTVSYTESVPKKPHTYNGKFASSSTHHWHNCSICGATAPESEKLPHNFVYDEINKNYKCECGKTKVNPSGGYIDPNGWT